MLPSFLNIPGEVNGFLFNGISIIDIRCKEANYEHIYFGYNERTLPYDIREKQVKIIGITKR